MFATVGGQLGQFMDRERSAEARARLLESEKAARVHAEVLAADLRRANQAKDEFLAVLGHELRNPLAPVRNALEVLRISGATDPQTLRMHEIMGRQVKHLARLVDDLLDVSRITRGRVELRRETTELATLVAGAAEGLRTFFEERGHRLEVSLPESPVVLNVDPLRMEQVLANLLSNAAKYTPQGGTISLSVEREGSEAVVRVKDNGIGIPPEMIERVFELFAQADRLPDTVHQGLGIGLTLVRRLVELHEGRVVARSPGRGQGSEFEVRLPSSVVSIERRRADPAAAGQRPRRILVVDDNEDSAESLAVMLRLAGHDVSTAHDGPSALESAQARAPEVILLDIGLPGMSGYDVARTLREQDGALKPLLIALTGYGQVEDRRRAQEAGFDLHFVKPLDLPRLERVLSTLDRERA
jgi:signal transduction histidine kinase/ActR/RegA family two-component response regulator